MKKPKDHEFAGKRKREFGSGIDREPDSGVLFSNNQKTKRGAPDYRGELKVNPKFFNELIDEGGLVKLSGWLKKTKAGELIVLQISRWKPGDPVRGETRNDDDDAFEIPE